MNLKQESEFATRLLKNKVVFRVTRHRSKEVAIEFTDGTRIFVDHKPEELEISITGGQNLEADGEQA